MSHCVDTPPAAPGRPPARSEATGRSLSRRAPDGRRRRRRSNASATIGSNWTPRPERGFRERARERTRTTIVECPQEIFSAFLTRLSRLPPRDHLDSVAGRVRIFIRSHAVRLSRSYVFATINASARVLAAGVVGVGMLAGATDVRAAVITGIGSDGHEQRDRLARAGRRRADCAEQRQYGRAEPERGAIESLPVQHAGARFRVQARKFRRHDGVSLHAVVPQYRTVRSGRISTSSWASARARASCARPGWMRSTSTRPTATRRRSRRSSRPSTIRRTRWRSATARSARSSRPRSCSRSISRTICRHSTPTS